MSIFATNAFAQLQEVRGVETRRIIYNGPRYDNYKGVTSTKYFGFEFKNTNSISVSVDVILYRRDWSYSPEPDKVITKKSFTLKPEEGYVLKQEEDPYFRVEDSDPEGYQYINYYYVEYKAYKVL